MTKENKSEYRQIQDSLVEYMGKVQANLSKNIGLSETVSNKRQLEAYQDLTPEDKAYLVSTKGDLEYAKYEREMERRLTRSREQTVRSFDEVLR